MKRNNCILPVPDINLLCGRDRKIKTKLHRISPLLLKTFMKHGQS